MVGKGPAEAELKQYFAGTKTKFMGLMQGEALSRACAAADTEHRTPTAEHPRPQALSPRGVQAPAHVGARL